MQFKARLKRKVGSRIVVVMDDGIAFRGFVRAVEEGIIVMDGVEETIARNVEWENTDLGECGFHAWCQVALPKVFINPNHISRVWMLPIEEQTKKEEGKEKDYFYFRDPLQVI